MIIIIFVFILTQVNFFNNELKILEREVAN